jgi:eukaryotic-like serine/threonine-protein kinase
MGNNPSSFKGDDLPVENVSWNDAQEFVKKLNTAGATGRSPLRFRLPTEAEWEYAARAGTQTAYYFGDDADYLGDYVWYSKNSGGQTHPVGQLKPNAFGLYDMLGNVWEWVEDTWHDSYAGAPADGRAWIDPGGESNRVLRGGGWRYVPQSARSAMRSPLARRPTGTATSASAC